MILLSFDIGIKNLAYCQIDTETKDILDWHILDCSGNKNAVLAVIEQLETAPNLLESDIILLEKQPSFNPTMRMVSTAIYVYFTIRLNYENSLNTKIMYYSAKHKLKICNSTEILDGKTKVNPKQNRKKNYYLNKKAAVEETRILIYSTGYLKFFEKSKKKDDLADCYLQALAYLQ